MDKKQKAIALLREHDALEARMRILKRETYAAVTEYGVSVGVWGMRPDHLRIQLEQEKEKEKEQTNG
jgi:hypothetical protein